MADTTDKPMTVADVRRMLKGLKADVAPAETEGDEQPPVVVETVKAEPLKTVETVKVVDDARQSKSKDK